MTPERDNGKSPADRWCMVYTIPPGFSIGRAVTSILRDVKMRTAGLHNLPERIVVLGAEEATISGKSQVIIAKYRTRMQKNPLWRSGPKYPRTPARFVRRIFRGMLNYKAPHGCAIYKRIIVTPSEQDMERHRSARPIHVSVDTICRKDLRCHPKITIEELVQKL